ncbi:hypothetical protein DYQ86_26070 [Acidobacteria bacterium AB60]|nr:hypothetical protein DYQ86_26070 [Acidobacteria bacterium AB60]
MLARDGLIYSSCKLAALALLGGAVTAAYSQVLPSEISNPRARAAESKYLPQLEALQQQIGTTTFPFQFQLARYVNAKSGRAALDRDGLEFVNFQHRTVLKVSGIYKASYEAGSQTENVRATRVLLDAGLPILRMAVKAVPDSDDYDAVGLEILYNTRDTSNEYSFEGREVLSAVFSRADARAFAEAASNDVRQEILNRSDVYVDGQAFAVALGQRTPLDLAVKEDKDDEIARAEAKLAESAKLVRASASRIVDVAPASSTAPARDVETSGAHTPAQGLLEHSGDRVLMHFSLQNSLTFNGENSSIYKRAAQSFDLFLAPQLRSLMKELPGDPTYDAFEFSVVNQVANGLTPSETVDFICPISTTRAFLDNKITSQELINQSTVLVNGMRIGLELAKVE